MQHQKNTLSTCTSLKSAQFELHLNINLHFVPQTIQNLKKLTWREPSGEWISHRTCSYHSPFISANCFNESNLICFSPLQKTRAAPTTCCSVHSFIRAKTKTPPRQYPHHVFHLSVTVFGWPRCELAGFANLCFNRFRQLCRHSSPSVISRFCTF